MSGWGVGGAPGPVVSLTRLAGLAGGWAPPRQQRYGSVAAVPPSPRRSLVNMSGYKSGQKVRYAKGGQNQRVLLKT